MLTKFYVSIKCKWDQYVKNEKGAQALEWIALGMLVLAIMGAIAATMKGDSTMGTAVKNQLVKMINSLSGD
ncbi:hypothetical protein [Lederbergia panacisoli]|uniref:hypothetical protein n=1 Tax=Lederbergia panacisoli TaxID=1255251 RepID=UPI00214AC1CD|nr:hypothetical protein [Lederbergia panacisoli]MCR2823702.1 hypothetical protein [Lederbergia panacisoli]